MAAPAPTTAAPASRSNPLPWIVGAAAVLLLVVGAVAVVVASSSKSSSSVASNAVSVTVPSTTTTTVARTTTTTMVTSTTSPYAPYLLFGTSGAVESAYGAAYELAAALAVGDWARARQLEPAKSGYSDAQFEQAYGDLEASTPVLVSASGEDPIALRLGLVANQDGGGVSQTTLYCVTWTVGPGPTVTQVAGQSSQLRVMPGLVAATDVVAEIRTSC